MKIVLSVVLAMLIVGCSNEKHEQKSTQNSVQKVQTTPSKSVKVEATVADTTKKIEKTVVKAKETTVAKVKEAVKTVKAPEVKAPEVKVDGAKLFVVCSSCHGAHAEKKALGQSQIIRGWKEAKIINALHGYKKGTYGGAMKAVMHGQASKLSDADIKALAKYISQL